jgi:ribosome biogenesis protein NSA1
MRLITGDECGLLKECIPELSTNAEEEEKNEAVSIPSRRRVLVSKDQGVELLNPDFLAENNKRTDASSSSSSSAAGLRRKGIVSLTWTAAHDDSQFASLHMDGTVQLWKSSSVDEAMSGNGGYARYRRVSEISNIFQTPTGETSTESEASNTTTTMMMDPLSKPIGLYAFETASANSGSTDTRLVACNAQGTVCILNPNHKSSNDVDENPTSPIVKSFETVKGNQNMTSTPTTKNIARLQYPQITATALDGQNVISTNTHTSSSSASPSSATPTRIALGGRDRDVMIWDLESSQQVYKAKNLPPDPQTLLQPLVWPTVMTFVQQSSAFNGSPHILAVGTAYNQVRIYDVRVHQAVMTMKTTNKSQSSSSYPAPMKQRPLAYSPLKDCPHVPLEHRVTTLLPMENDSCHLVVGDAAGYLQTMDMRLLEKNTSHTSKSSIHGQQYGQAQPSCMVGRFVGPEGSVRGLAQDGKGEMLAAVGLDRMLRLYETSTRKQVYCMYLKQRLNCVLCGRQDAKKKRNGKKDSHDNENNDDDDDAGEDGYDSADMDADDVVEDYVDSSDDDEEYKGKDGPNSNEKRSHLQEDEHDGDDDDASSSEDDVDNDSGESSSDASTDEEEEDDDNDAAPPKKRRR